MEHPLIGGIVKLYKNEKERKIGAIFFSSVLILYVFGNLAACLIIPNL
jgi:hypothetical protein